MFVGILFWFHIGYVGLKCRISWARKTLYCQRSKKSWLYQ